MSKEDMLEALQEIADYLDQYSDADFNDHFYVPNEAMRLQQKAKQIAATIARLNSNL
jgi:hypothetical protein